MAHDADVAEPFGMFDKEELNGCSHYEKRKLPVPQHLQRRQRMKEGGIAVESTLLASKSQTMLKLSHDIDENVPGADKMVGFQTGRLLPSLMWFPVHADVNDYPLYNLSLLRQPLPPMLRSGG